MGETEASERGKADRCCSQESQWTASYERSRAQEIISAHEGAVGSEKESRLAQHGLSCLALRDQNTWSAITVHAGLIRACLSRKLATGAHSVPAYRSRCCRKFPGKVGPSARSQAEALRPGVRQKEKVSTDDQNPASGSNLLSQDRLQMTPCCPQPLGIGPIR